MDSLEELDKSLSQLMQMTKNNSRATVVLGGDFNAGEINWDTCTVSETTKRLVCEKILDIFGNYSITQLQRDPTREGALLDLIGTNKPGLVKSVNTIPGISDHDIIVLDVDLKAERTKKAPHKVYQWDKANWEQMKPCTKVFATKYLTEAHSRNTKTNYQAIENHLCNMMTAHVPSKLTRTRTDLPWMTNTLKRMCKRKHRLYNRARQNKTAESWNRYKETQF